MSKIDKKLTQTKYGNDPVAYFENLPNVDSVRVCQDEIFVLFKRESKHIFPAQYDRCEDSEDGRFARISRQ